MPKKKSINSDKLIKAVQSGKSSTEIMKEFGIKTSAQLKAKYLDAMIEKGEIPAIKTTRPGKKAGPKPKLKSLKVNKRGSLVIPKKLVEELGFKVGDVFFCTEEQIGDEFEKNVTSNHREEDCAWLFVGSGLLLFIMSLTVSLRAYRQLTLF